MRDYLPYVVLGLTSGSIYGLAAIGLVLTYKTSGLFNFAHGALAATGAYFFYWLHVTEGWSWGLAFAVVVGVLGPLLGLLMELFARRLANVGTVLKVVGTVGIILVVQGLATIKYQANLVTVPRFLPAGTFTVFGAAVSWGQIITMVIGAVAAAGLYLFLRFTHVGASMRGVVDDPELLALTGGSPVAVRRVSWVVGTTLAVLAGVLIAPNIDLDAVVLTFLVVQAFGAAALGAFASLPIAYLGGCAIGVVAALSTKWSSSDEVLKGFPSALPFYVLLAVLLVLPRRKLVAAGVERARVRAPWRAPAGPRVLTAVVVTGLLAALPWLVGYRITDFTGALVQVMLLLSLGLLVRTSGQVSLCHMAFAAVGAVAFSQLAVDHGWPWLLALLVAGLIAVPVGALVAIPAIRLSGLFLALATLGFGVAVEYMFYPLGFMFTTNASGRLMPHPSFAEDDRSFYLLVLACVVVTAVVVVAITESRLGRLLRGMSDSPVAIATLGLELRVTRVLVFCVSAFFAAIAGALLGVELTTATADSYPSFQSLVLLAVLALAPFGEPWYALFAAAGLAVIPIYVDAANTTNWLNVMFGVFAVVVALQGGTPEAPPALRRFFERFAWRPATGSSTALAATALAATASAATSATAGPATARLPAAVGDPRDPGRAGLEIAGLTVRHGGLVAVKDLMLQAPPGRITGLIGPNGAGKTTTFNASTGLARPSAGTVRLHGRDVTRLNPAARGRRGLGRTFQRMELFDSLTVEQNVDLGREAAIAGTSPWRQLVARRSEAGEIAARTGEALEVCGIRELAGQRAGLLSTGDRRLVELARCLAGNFDVLLLDEPSSGLDREERARFAEILRRVRAERAAAILLVEHDMSLVMGICDYVYVLDFGALIFEGTPDQVRASAAVQAAYLGSDAVEPVPAAARAGSLTLEVDHG
jgi:ABC-type branched-subunit amino acid transport system ATPase component/branched-subunit amino acid ABC-type transport system permease component